MAEKNEKLISMKIPTWVLEELLEEKEGWIESGDGQPFEEWIVKNLSKYIRKTGRK